MREDIISDEGRCNCCGEYVGDWDTGLKICSCDTGSCQNCRGTNSLLK